MAENQTLLDVPLSKAQIQDFYTRAAPAYDDLTARFEARPKRLAIDRLSRKPGEKYLEVAVGTGTSIIDVARRSGAEGVVGMDFTPAMVDLTHRRLSESGAGSVALLLADARHLPFADASFDCLFNSYMLDLIPTEEISLVLEEFRRVLKPGGRLVLANLTEGEAGDAAFSKGWKESYSTDPVRLGGCRPVLASRFVKSAGFVQVRRTYCGGESWPTEVVSARVRQRRRNGGVSRPRTASG